MIFQNIPDSVSYPYDVISISACYLVYYKKADTKDPFRVSLVFSNTIYYKFENL